MNKKKWAIGVDLGGTKIEVAFVNSSGLLHDRLRLVTDSQHRYNDDRAAAWCEWVGDQGKVIGISEFGASAPYKEIYEHYGITVKNIVSTTKKLIKEN
jgi:predicted NBD/HSP70 family sugar kinase